MGSTKEKVEKKKEVPRQKPGEKLARDTETNDQSGKKREVTEKLKLKGAKANCKWLKSEEVVAIFNNKAKKGMRTMNRRGSSRGLSFFGE